MKNIVTVTGIRPDFVRMSEVFKKLDANFNHTLIHTGQHFDNMLSDVFFKELEIREPDFNLKIGGPGKEHYHQTAELSTKLLDLFKSRSAQTDLIIFLGDSNSVLASVPLKKEGFRIAHIEAGMRSGDKRMLEEINRTVCDHCSDYHFVYHEDYKQNLLAENLPEKNIHVVGNTIVEVFNKYINYDKPSAESHIVLDIHRPENFNYPVRMQNILQIARDLSYIKGLPVYMLNFKRTMNAIKQNNIFLYTAKEKDLMSYKEYLQFQYDSLFIISDSGTAQEEPALMAKPVIVPRDFTERPQSMYNSCSYMLDVNDSQRCAIKAVEVCEWLEKRSAMNIKWLGNGDTSELIINQLKKL